MKKFCFKISVLVLFVLSFFTSCDLFLQGAEMKDEINKAIEHEKADFCKVEISANPNTVSKIVPAANLYTSQYKPTDTIDLTFEPSSAWKFHYWSAEPEDSVEFSDIKALKTTATLLNDNDSENIIIIPKCEQRPEPSLAAPNDPINPKNSSITIRFLHPMSIPEDYLKDIKIEIAGEDVSNYFETPVLQRNNYDIFIAAKADNIMDFNSGTKIVKVTVPSKFYYTVNGMQVEMAEDKVLEYKINHETIEKLSFKLEKGRYGEFDSDINVEKNIYETYVVNYTLNAGCYFDRWEISTDSIDKNSTDSSVAAKKFVIEEDESGKVKLIKNADGKAIFRISEPTETEAAILEARNMYKITLEALSTYDETIIIRPMAYERPTVSISPSASSAVAKNSPISINFSKPIENLSEMLDKITIEVDEQSVRDCFETPVCVDNKEITFNANLSKLIDTQNVNKTVKVTIPKDCYYLDGQTKVYLGSDVVYNYKITSATSVKGEFNFKEIIAGNTKINYSGAKSYNIGDSFTVKVTSEDSAYQFAGWHIATDSGALPTGALSIEEDKLNKQATITVLNQITGVNIYPVYYPRPIIKNFTPNTPGSNTTFKDSSIVIDFSAKIDSSYLDKITITKDDEDISNCFLKPTLSNDDTTVTFVANYDSLMEVKGTSEAVIVSLPEDLSYKAEDGTVITAGVKQSKTYRVKSETSKKLRISFSNPSSGGTMTYAGTYELSLGDSITVSYSTTTGYSFTGWTIAGALNAVEFDENETSKNTIKLTAKKEDSITVTGNTAFYPEITDYEPKYTSLGTNCDTPIVITFNTEIDETTLNSSTIKLTNRQTGLDYTNDYFHFKSEVTDKGVTKLTIIPDPYINKLFTGTKTSYQIDVKFNKDNIFAKNKAIINGVETTAKLTGLDNWYYVINSGYEDVLPVLKEIHLYKDAGYTNELTEKEFSLWQKTDTSDDFDNNHVKDLYVKVIGYDADSGLKQLDVCETYYKTVSEVDVTKDPVKSVMGNKNSFIELKNTNNEPIYDASGNKLYEFKGQYQFSKDFNDGVIKLEFRLVDRAGDQGNVIKDHENERGNYTQPKTFYVIKDTSIPLSHILPIWTNLNDDDRVANEYGMDVIKMIFLPQEEYMTDAYYGKAGYKEVKVDIPEEYWEEVGEKFYYDKVYDPGYHDEIKITDIRYGYSINDITKRMTFTQEYVEGQQVFTYTFERDPTRETYIKISAADGVGNTCERFVAIPETGMVLQKNKHLISLETYNTGRSSVIPSTFADSDGNIPEYEVLLKNFAENCPIEYKAISHITTFGCDSKIRNGIIWESCAGRTPEEKGSKVFKAPKVSVDLNEIEPTEEQLNDPDYSYQSTDYYFYDFVKYVKTIYQYEFDNWLIYGLESNIIDLTQDAPESSIDEYIPRKIESYTLESLKLNTGARFIETKFDNTYTKNNDYSYYVGYQIYDDATEQYDTFFSYSANPDFSLTSDKKYRLYPFVKTKSGDYIKRSNAEYIEIDLTGEENDNIPPKLDLPETASERVSSKPGSVTLPFPTDNIGLKTDENGNGEIKYWFIPNSTVTSAITPRPESYFSDGDARRITFDVNNPPENMIFNLDDLPEYSYTLFIKIEDRRGNYTFLSAYANNVLFENNISFEYFTDVNKVLSDDETKSYFKCVFPDQYDTCYLNTEYFNGNLWKEASDDWGCDKYPFYNDDVYDPETSLWKSEYNLTFFFVDNNVVHKEHSWETERDEEGNEVHEEDGSEKKSEKISTLEYRFNIYASPENEEEDIRISSLEECNSYIRLLARDMAYGDGTANGYYKVVYVYPKYYLGGITCKNKFMLSNSSGDIQILADAPVLVHTFYCSADFGNNVDKWLNQGIETGIEQEDSGFTYSRTNLKGIPEGKYYVIIAHFADGTTTMTDVKQK